MTMCPNVQAKKDSSFNQADAIAKKQQCFYWTPKVGYCTGIGHCLQHHIEALTPDARKAYDQHKARQASKGGGKNKKKSLQLYDLEEWNEDE